MAIPINIRHRVQKGSGEKVIRVKILSDEEITRLSWGEVKTAETINYRTLKPERDGLFCAQIFGPVKDWECLCGKYKRLKHRGVVCEKCGVEITRSSVRRERMGHIKLASPVVHIWFLKSLPSRIGMILGISLKDIEQVIYFEKYVVTDPGVTDLTLGQLLTEAEYQDRLEEQEGDFVAMSGAEAVLKLLKQVDIKQEIQDLKQKISDTTSDLKIKQLMRRVRALEYFSKSGNKPESMVLNTLPILPPDLRPLVPLEGGRFATSDLNDLYRRVINRNNRLKRLQELFAPDIIQRNEKRMLQEAVDALIDNTRAKTIVDSNKRQLKSLADVIKGKQGRFRGNLLGKRVDYSGRSVIVCGPGLEFHQCGLPKQMALELFKPFVFCQLQQKGLASTIKVAKHLVEEADPCVWGILESVVKDHPILLNRAPTLHRLGIQAFEPKIVEGKAIQLHPLVCHAFNADFDGDQMAVHVPLSIEAQMEARCLMMSSNNLLSPADGKPIMCPTQDIVLGIYYLTRESINESGEGMVFSDSHEVINALNHGAVSLHAKIRVRFPIDSGWQYVDTTVGRVVLWSKLGRLVEFESVNRVIKSKDYSEIIIKLMREYGEKEVAQICDKLKQIGFHYATRSGISVGVNDLKVPTTKSSILKAAEAEVGEVTNQYASGLLTSKERYNRVVDIWTVANEKVSKAMMDGLMFEEKMDSNKQMKKQRSFNSIFMMADSGARGSKAQMRQLSGMRGLMTKPDGGIIETPITANFREGLDVIQYFISTHGSRKGLADLALKTANSGYLTRRLVDASQDVIVQDYDCGAKNGIDLKPIIEGRKVVASLKDRIKGRVLLNDLFDKNGRMLLERNTLITEDNINQLDKMGDTDLVQVRSPVTCENSKGVCVLCYGEDPASGRIVSEGEAVGVIAAQSIGEPGTQLTMRTFHVGGAASSSAIESEIKCYNDGKVRFNSIRTIDRSSTKEKVVISRSGYVSVFNDKGQECERYKVPYGAAIKVSDGDLVKNDQLIACWEPHLQPVISEVSGALNYVGLIDHVNLDQRKDEGTGKMIRIVGVSDQTDQLKPMLSIVGSGYADVNYALREGAQIIHANGDQIESGEVIAKIPLESSKTKDITGGLPRVSDLFEARMPRNPAILSELSGVVSLGKSTKEKRRLIVTAEDGKVSQYLLPKWRDIRVNEGEQVRKGDLLVDGPLDLHAINRILGSVKMAEYFINEVLDVYRLQGVAINEKHIEVILRQMLRQCIIVDPGDTSFLQGDQIAISQVKKANMLLPESKVPAEYEVTLLGITRGSLTTESFVSAASFQETTRVLTEASFRGQTDYLKGLKENVMVGNLIPAGTGFKKHRINTAKDFD
ncbi:DNA-directed RNA polymerase subunit beta' [Gammaproteobacteria bacterium]|nr:DNA-directed RNA polymerase subunit beta' [Gammaproteobacteria bacterium]